MFYELFFDLTKKRNFRHLVRSPIGSVRNKVKTESFAAKICEFHRITGASVKIMSYFQKSPYRTLRNGLSHKSFIQYFQCAISINLISQKVVQQPDKHFWNYCGTVIITWKHSRSVEIYSFRTKFIRGDVGWLTPFSKITENTLNPGKLCGSNIKSSVT